SIPPEAARDVRPRPLGHADDTGTVQIPTTVDLSRDKTEELSTRDSLDGPEPERTPHPQQMLHRWGLIGWLMGKLFFSRVFFPREGVERIREAAKIGTVVYVMRLRSTVNFLYWNYAFMAHGLPLARFANGLRRYFWQPLKMILQRLFSRAPDPVDTLRDLTTSYQSSAIFLRSHAVFGTPDFDGPYLRTLIEIQRKTQRPIVLVPLTVLWGKKNVRDVPRFTLVDTLLGNQDEPRTMRRLWQVVRHASRSHAVVAEPLRLDDFLATQEHQKHDDDAPKTSARGVDGAHGAPGEPKDRAENHDLADTLQANLRERIESERRVRIGPRRRHFLQLRRNILEHPHIQTLIQQRADETGKSAQQVHRQATKTLKKMQAQMSSKGLARLKGLVDKIWRRIYGGFEIDERKLNSLLTTGRQGPLLFLPTHRSHIDYLVLSDLLVTRGILPPHIAAGINLSFWPMGWFFRTAGAFFLRRRYQGDALYSALLKAYVAELLKEGHNLEIFIEGGRSRTGKVLHPKLGLLSIIADLCAAGEVPSVNAVPVSIGYERLVELQSVTRELAGGRKRPENVAGMIRGARVLRSKRGYGYVNVQFGEPIEIASFLALRDFRGPDADPEVRRRAIRSLGYHSLTRAGRITAVTPTSLVAAAVLAPGTRGIPRELLDQAVQLFAVVAKSSGARFVSTLWRQEGKALDDAALETALSFLSQDEALQVRGGDHDRIYVSEDQARIRLEYYKNLLTAHLLGPSLIAIVLRAMQSRDLAAVDLPSLRDATRFVLSLVRLHFVENAGEKPDETFDRWMGQMVDLELVRIDAREELVYIDDAAVASLDLLAGLIEGTMETYSACARAMLQMIRGGSRRRKELEEELLRHLHRWHLTGNLRRFESCQVPLVSVVIDWLCEEGILTQTRDDSGDVKVTLPRQHKDGRALQVLIERTERLLIER
ncbi:MAG: 1-acyl-sn-glycerol-3-phosphate acyltransferase, partial [Deltaproteobacteria bacterium]|nr:1-acyl-sn-glycerol-3-phosphate acyltransferase [Deltaproteobacteria bacterium]